MVRLGKRSHWNGIALAAVAVIIMFGAATTASAQSICDSTTSGSCMDHDFSYTEQSPCTFELVTWYGHFHVVNNSNSNNNYAWIKFQTQSQGKGTGPSSAEYPSGRQYTVGHFTKFNARFDLKAFTDGPIIVRATDRVISQGSSATPDNWFATFAEHVNAQGETVKMQNESGCRG